MVILQAALAGFAASAGLIIAIGAQNAFVLRHGLQRQHVWLVVAVCALSDVSLIIAGVAGVGALVRDVPVLLTIMRFGGAAFLGLYGLKAASRAYRGSNGLKAGASKESDWRRVLVACLAVTFLNPHVYLDTMVLLGGISTRYPGASQSAFAIGACCASIIWFSTLGIGSRLLQPVFRNPAAWRVLDGLMALFMLVLCLLLLLSPVNVG